MKDTPGTELAPDDQQWLCAACGKTSRSRYGFDADSKRCADHGWDEACMMNAVLVYKEKNADGKWQAVVDEDAR